MRNTVISFLFNQLVLWFSLIQENLGRITKSWSDFTSLNYWVVRDYYRLVNSVNALELQIQRLSDEQVSGFQLFVKILWGLNFGTVKSDIDGVA